MISEYYLLIFLYPISYALFQVSKKLKIDESISLKFLFTSFFFVFYGLFSTYVVSSTENGYLFMTTIIYSLAIFKDDLTLSNIYKYFTYYWSSLLLIWGFISFTDTLLILGVIPLLMANKKTNMVIGKLVIWLSLVFFNNLIPQIGVGEGLIFKNWLIELFFVLLALLTIPDEDRKHHSNLLQYLLCLGVFHMALANFGMMPSTFVKLLIVGQLVSLFMYLKTEELKYLTTGLIFGSLVLIPYEGVSTLTQMSLVAYGAVFIYDKYKLNYVRQVYTAAHLTVCLYIFYLIYKVDLNGSPYVTVSTVILFGLIAINFMFRERLFLSRKLIKFNHG